MKLSLASLPFTFTRAAYNLIRLPRLIGAAAA
jgi:hypothetical protein